MSMSHERAPRVIPPPATLPSLGPLVVVDGDCAYFHDGRPTCTAFALPGHLSGSEYQAAMNIGMRRSGTVVYRPICDGCRRCQPIRVRVGDFVPSRSQKRVQKRVDGMFQVRWGRPILDDEHLELYARYQAGQHGEHAQSADEKSYRRFLIDSVTDTIELSWRDEDGTLIGVGILDVTPDSLSSVYFYWDPTLRKLSLGTYSALYEIELARRWKKRFYYLGYLVAGSKTMSYKADFAATEVWTGHNWDALDGRGVEAPGVQRQLKQAEVQAIHADMSRFSLSDARPLPIVAEEDDDEDDL